MGHDQPLGWVLRERPVHRGVFYSQAAANRQRQLVALTLEGRAADVQVAQVQPIEIVPPKGEQRGDTCCKVGHYIT